MPAQYMTLSNLANLTYVIAKRVPFPDGTHMLPGV